MINNGVSIQQFPSAIFHGLVESFRLYEFHSDQPVDMNPEGNFELVFQLEGQFGQKFIDENTWNIRPDYFVGGLHSKSFQVKSFEKNTKVLSVRFTPTGARHFMPDKLNAFKNSLIDLRDLSKQINELDLRNTSLGSIQNGLDKFLMKSYKDYRKNMVDLSLEMILLSKGTMSIQSICQKLNVSPSYLRKCFNEQIGNSPKEYARVVRVNYAMTLVEQGATTNFTSLATALGYFDQAHFIKDFKSVTGRTPRKYFMQY